VFSWGEYSQGDKPDELLLVVLMDDISYIDSGAGDDDLSMSPISFPSRFAVHYQSS